MIPAHLTILQDAGLLPFNERMTCSFVCFRRNGYGWSR